MKQVNEKKRKSNKLFLLPSTQASGEKKEICLPEMVQRRKKERENESEERLIRKKETDDQKLIFFKKVFHNKKKLTGAGDMLCRRDTSAIGEFQFVYI